MLVPTRSCAEAVFEAGADAEAGTGTGTETGTGAWAMTGAVVGVKLGTWAAADDDDPEFCSGWRRFRRRLRRV